MTPSLEQRALVALPLLALLAPTSGCSLLLDYDKFLVGDGGADAAAPRPDAGRLSQDGSLADAGLAPVGDPDGGLSSLDGGSLPRDGGPLPLDSGPPPLCRITPAEAGVTGTDGRVCLDGFDATLARDGGGEPTLLAGRAVSACATWRMSGTMYVVLQASTRRCGPRCTGELCGTAGLARLYDGDRWIEDVVVGSSVTWRGVIRDSLTVCRDGAGAARASIFASARCGEP